jgi:hypothetical protein
LQEIIHWLHFSRRKICHIGEFSDLDSSIKDEPSSFVSNLFDILDRECPNCTNLFILDNFRWILSLMGDGCSDITTALDKEYPGIRFNQFPEILMISFQKSSTPIGFCDVLSLEDYATDPSLCAEYDLFGAVLHTGTAFMRLSEEWFSFDGTDVKTIPDHHHFGGQPSLLFYVSIGSLAVLPNFPKAAIIPQLRRIVKDDDRIFVLSCCASDPATADLVVETAPFSHLRDYFFNVLVRVPSLRSHDKRFFQAIQDRCSDRGAFVDWLAAAFQSRIINLYYPPSKAINGLMSVILTAVELLPPDSASEKSAPLITGFINALEVGRPLEDHPAILQTIFDCLSCRYAYPPKTLTEWSSKLLDFAIELYKNTSKRIAQMDFCRLFDCLSMILTHDNRAQFVELHKRVRGFQKIHHDTNSFQSYIRVGILLRFDGGTTTDPLSWQLELYRMRQGDFKRIITDIRNGSAGQKKKRWSDIFDNLCAQWSALRRVLIAHAEDVVEIMNDTRVDQAWELWNKMVDADTDAVFFAVRALVAKRQVTLPLLQKLADLCPKVRSFPADGIPGLDRQNMPGEFMAKFETFLRRHPDHAVLSFMNAVDKFYPEGDFTKPISALRGPAKEVAAIVSAFVGKWNSLAPDWTQPMTESAPARALIDAMLLALMKHRQNCNALPVLIRLLLSNNFHRKAAEFIRDFSPEELAETHNLVFSVNSFVKWTIDALPAAAAFADALFQRLMEIPKPLSFSEDLVAYLMKGQAIGAEWLILSKYMGAIAHRSDGNSEELWKMVKSHAQSADLNLEELWALMSACANARQGFRSDDVRMELLYAICKGNSDDIESVLFEWVKPRVRRAAIRKACKLLSRDWKEAGGVLNLMMRQWPDDKPDILARIPRDTPWTLFD